MSLSARQQSGKLLGVANFKICAGLLTRFGQRTVGVSIPGSIIGLRKAFNLLKSPPEFEPSTVGWQLCSQLASRLLPQGKY